MPIFLRSLPLSLGTLWHYIFLLPLVFVASVPFVLLALIPIVGLLVGPAIATFFTFAGYRCALAARGHGNEPSFGKLARASLFYGFLNTLVGAFFLFASIAIVVIAAKLGLRPTDPLAAEGISAWLPGVAIIGLLLLNSLFTCAIAVPMTVVAAAATPNRSDPGPFVGICQGLFSLSLVWFLWLAGIFFIGVGAIMTESVTFAVQHTVGNLPGRAPTAPAEIHLLPLVGAVAYLLWGGCWFYATAVLAWERMLDRRKVEEVETTVTTRMSAEDLRAWREARLPKDG